MHCILLLKNAVWKITIWHSLRADATPDHCHPRIIFSLHCHLLCIEASFFFIIVLYTFASCRCSFCLCFCFAVIFFSLSSPTPKKTRDELFAYCLLRKMENNKKMKNEENKNSSYRWWVFSCVVAQNIKQHSEEFEDEGEEEVAEKFSNLIFLCRNIH